MVGCVFVVGLLLASDGASHEIAVGWLRCFVTKLLRKCLAGANYGRAGGRDFLSCAKAVGCDVASREMMLVCDFNRCDRLDGYGPSYDVVTLEVTEIFPAIF